MALSKKQNGKKSDDGVQEIKPPYIITEASINDDFCDYTFEINEGIGLGDTHKVKGSGIIKDDMRKAFSKFNVHLACIDDVFKHSDIEVNDIDNLHTDELTGHYHVTGFKIKGSKENESIILKGLKYVSSAGGRITIESPKISLDKLSSYKWYNELKTASDNAREEVKLYKEGKYEPVEEEVKPNPKQMSILDNPDIKVTMSVVKGEDHVEEFNSAKQ